MKYVSIDLETTGLDPETCQIIEIGAIVDDLATLQPIESLPKFHCYVVHPLIQGDPFALSMNAAILDRIAKKMTGYMYLTPDKAADHLFYFMNDQAMVAFNVAGKNFATFDRPFIERLPGAKEKLKFHRRVLDPAVLYWQPGDNMLPDTKECLKRARIDKEPSHTALEDAADVIRLIRTKLRPGWELVNMETKK